MRIVGLALTILLAAGCQARSLQADAQNEYEQIRTAVVTYLGQVKETAQKAIDGFDDAKYKAVKIQSYLEGASGSLSTVRETFGPQIMQYISEIRAKVDKEIEVLHMKLEPKREELRQVLKKHFDEYREKLEPLIKEYQEKNHEQLEQLRVKVEPVMKELQEKIKTNVEDTKSKLIPFVEVLRNELTERLEHLREQVEPYVQEYREKVKSTTDALWTNYESGDLQKEVQTMGKDLKPHMEGIFNTIHKAIQPYWFLW